MKFSKDEKPTVILVPGMWSTEDTFKEVQEAFIDQGYATESLSLPYHYSKKDHTIESKKSLSQTRLQDYVAFIVEQVKRQETPPILVGHSMGGLLIQLVAAQVPCQSLILLSSAPPATVNGVSISAIRTFGMNLLRLPLWKSITEVKLKHVRYGLANSQNDTFQQEIYSNTTYESGMATFQIIMGHWLRKKSSSYVKVQNIHCPVLVIGGTEDRITPIKIQRSIAKNFGDRAQLLEVDGCCHWTIGGKYFPTVRAEIFNWLEKEL